MPPKTHLFHSLLTQAVRTPDSAKILASHLHKETYHLQVLHDLHKEDFPTAELMAWTDFLLNAFRFEDLLCHFFLLFINIIL